MGSGRASFGTVTVWIWTILVVDRKFRLFLANQEVNFTFGLVAFPPNIDPKKGSNSVLPNSLNNWPVFYPASSQRVTPKEIQSRRVSYFWKYVFRHRHVFRHHPRLF